MSSPDTPAAAIPCDHHWISAHEPGHRVYWVRHCSLCGSADWDDLDREIDTLVEAGRAAERARIRDMVLEGGQNGETIRSRLLADLLGGDGE